MGSKRWTEVHGGTVMENSGLTVGHYDFGWICEGHQCAGGGDTRSEALDNWVKKVTDTMHPGGYHTRHAKRDVKLYLIEALKQGVTK